MSSNHIDRFFRALIKHFPGIIMSVFSLLSILAVSVLLILMMRNWSPHIHPANAHLVILGGLMALSGIALWRKWDKLFYAAVACTGIAASALALSLGYGEWELAFFGLGLSLSVSFVIGAKTAELVRPFIRNWN